ncbi:hypothetical protein HZS35_04295 [Pantoea brenneri]|jgi:DNA-directed RNA polymerase subunit RPC12/RpoP|uniref:Uncharacterized protein n=2 Tax=Pantoea brenneri TaxID=472694 RepID=A0A7Y6NBW2_9GAMM|nr:hypothetical protein EP46_09175 [Pantoea sp. 3.5.1]MBS6032508.1 hypothetical protein [Pantoea sp.]NUY40518.1 hypothetical protein [Pantoea brenneri]OXM26727.1 hypothetical protein CBI35_02550 [Pantoea sp. AV62]NUY48018.1 hypothetical protein [Pantoea brenneri]
MVMKIRCNQCGSARFIFTERDGEAFTFHGACCAHCKKRLEAKDLLPETPMDPIAHCLIDQHKNASGT